MRKTRFFCFVLLAACLTAHAQQPAYRADAFTDFVGLNASPFERYLDSGPFQGAGTKYPPETFFALGVRHYRTGLKNDLTPADAPARIRAAYDQYGARPMLLIDPGKSGTPADIVARLKDYGPGVVALLEGPNEVNNKFPPQELNLKYKGKTDEAAGATYMDDVYAAVKANPATKTIGVVSFTAIFTDYRLARPHASFDFANMHSYQGYDVPSSSLEMNETRANNILPPGAVIRPFVPTECGYNVEQDRANGTLTTGSLRAQALNTPMLLAEYFRYGVQRAYLFALHNADGYGLLESDQTTKRPAYHALQNLLAEVKDARWDAAGHRWVGGDGFMPRALLFSTSGATPTVHSLTLQKKHGDYRLLIWNEVRNFDQDAHKDVENAPVPVTLHFETPVKAQATILTQNAGGGYDAQTASVQNNALRLDVPSSVMIVRLTPAASAKRPPPPAPRSVAGTATENSVRLSWQAPASTTNVAGYFVFRNGRHVATVHGRTFADNSSWLRPGLGYTYAVQSYDRAGRVSARVSQVVTTPDRRPDLVCTGVDIPTVSAGDSVVFRATLKNTGDGATPSDTVTGLTFFVDGQYTTYATTDGTPLAPGESRVLAANGGRGSNRWTATPGAHVLRVQTDDINRVPGERDEFNNDLDRSLTVGPSTPGLLRGSADPTAGQVDLTAEGTADWVHWGLGNKDAVNRKAAGGNQIGALVKIGPGYLDATPGFGLSARWSDGTPTQIMPDTHASLWLNNVGTGYTFSAPADTTARVLKVYVGGIEGAGGKLTAHLSDASAPDYVSATFNGNAAFPWAAVPGGFTGVYTLRYRAAGPNQTLTVTWTLDSEPNRFLGQARLQAATLALAP